MYIESGYLKGRKVIVSKAKLRPTTSVVKSALFNIIGSQVKNKSFLDCFAGTGIVGFEALSNGASNIGFVELNSFSVKVLKQNILQLDIKDKAVVKYQNVFDVLEGEHEQWDVIFFSPPYDSTHWYQLFRSIEISPLVHKSSFIIIQHPKQITLDPLTLKLLKTKQYGYNQLSLYAFPK